MISLTITPHRLVFRGFLAISALLGLLLLAPARAQEGQELGTWAFSYPDNTKPGAVLDLRFLNETTAGESGFVRLSPDGNSFVLGNGKPARFWACGSDIYRGTSEDMAKHARFLAKLGVNMVRLHTQIAPDTDGPITHVNEKEIDGIWRMVAALKKEGIYTTISPYWANGKKASQWGIDGYTGQTDLWGLLFFNEKLQAGYKAWVKALYARPNPYTNIPLAKDPAVAIIQVQNEDGMFFWTMQEMKPEQQALLGRKFVAWLTMKYGTLDAAKAAWAGALEKNDDWEHGQVVVLPTWNLTQETSGGLNTRVADQVHFFADTQRGFYASITDYYKNTLGCKQLVNASNWFTADPIKLNDLERYTYTATDVVAVNKYYNGGVHLGDNNGWRIDPGHHFTSVSALTNPRDLPTNLKQVVGHPMVITESSWVAPLGYQSEGPFLMAAYQSLTGVDTFYWFSASTPEYQTDLGFSFLTITGSHPLTKWSANVPEIMGNFPANALLYRRGYLREGAPVVQEVRPLTDLWERKTPLIAEDKSFDPNRAGTGAGQSAIAHGIDPLAFLVGPVQVTYGGEAASTKVANLIPYLDTANQVVKSETGEIRLNYGKGLCVVNAPKAQGITGFLSKAGRVTLGDIVIESSNPYATVEVVSMDNLPLRVSHKVLVQVGTAARPTGWDAKAVDFPAEDGKSTLHGYEVVKTGTGPWQIVNAQVTLTVTNASLTKATLLDAAGYAAKTVPVTRANGKLTLTLPPNTMYVVLE
jgi:hypothetical protein